MVPTSHHNANFSQAEPMPRSPFNAGGGDYNNISARGIGTNKQSPPVQVAECQHLRVTLLSHQHICNYLQDTYNLQPGRG